MSKNRKYNKKAKRPNGIPTSTMRMDRELMAEIKMYYSLCNDIVKTAVAYHVTESMVRYALNKGKDFDKLQNDLEKEENK